MKKRIFLALTVGLLAAYQPAMADPSSDKQLAVSDGSIQLLSGPTEKAASTRTVGARGFVSTNAPMYGSFELAASSVVYLLVRGNSLATLGVTQAYLDYPRAIIYDGAATPILSVSGFPGFNGCFPGLPSDQPVRDYYAARGIPVSQNDACLAVQLAAGVYTFKVVPSVAGSTATTNSVPSAGEILFEVKLGP